MPKLTKIILWSLALLGVWWVLAIATILQMLIQVSSTF